jgi:uncharacterized CHY-type Zn-finger protein
MTQLRTKVQCFRCSKKVDVNITREIKTLSKESRYECFRCFQKNKREPLLAGVEKPLIKKEYICERCKYKFKSKKAVCPYCNKNDYVTSSNVSVKELI